MRTRLLGLMVLISTLSWAGSSSFDDVKKNTQRFMAPLLYVDRYVADDGASTFYAHERWFALDADEKLHAFVLARGKLSSTQRSTWSAELTKLATDRLTAQKRLEQERWLLQVDSAERHRVIEWTRAAALAELTNPQLSSMHLPLSVAAFDFSSEVHARLLSLHTEVRTLELHGRCAGDLTRDRQLQRYFSAVLSQDARLTASALLSIARQLPCLSHRQLRQLDRIMADQAELAIARMRPAAGAFNDKRYAQFAARMRELYAPLFYLIGDQTRLVGKSLLLAWLSKYSAELQVASKDPMSLLFATGFGFYDRYRDAMVTLSSACQPGLSKSTRFRGPKGGPWLKWQGDSCNSLPALIGAVGLPCSAVDYIPVGDSADVATDFVCDPGCGSSALPLKGQRTASGALPLVYPDTFKCTGGSSGSAVGSAPGDTSDGSRPSVGGSVGNVTIPSGGSCASAVIGAAVANRTSTISCLNAGLPNYRTVGNLSGNMMPSGGARCGGPNVAAPGGNVPARGECASATATLQCVGSMQTADGSYNNLYQDEDGTYLVEGSNGQIVVTTDLTEATAALYDRESAEKKDEVKDAEQETNQPAPPTPAPPAAPAPPADPADAPETAEESEILNLVDWFLGLFGSGEDTTDDDTEAPPDGCGETPGCSGDAMCDPTSGSCSASCTAGDAATSAVMGCLSQASAIAGAGNLRAPGKDPRNEQVTYPAPDAPDQGVTATDAFVCLAGGYTPALGLCAGQMFAQCEQGTANCGCRSVPSTVAMPSSGSCNTVQCPQGSSAVSSGSTCTCRTSTTGGSGVSPPPLPTNQPCSASNPNCNGASNY